MLKHRRAPASKYEREFDAQGQTPHGQPVRSEAQDDLAPRSRPVGLGKTKMGPPVYSGHNLQTIETPLTSFEIAVVGPLGNGQEK